MEGPVGFAYGYLPESWKERPTYNHYQLILKESSLVLMGKNHNDVPRRENDDWDEECLLLTVEEAVNLCKACGAQSKPNHSYAEIVFRASDAIFGDPLLNLKEDISQLLCRNYENAHQALGDLVSELIGLDIEGILNSRDILNQEDKYEDLINDYVTRLYPSIDEWLTNKPHWSIYLYTLFAKQIKAL